MENSFQSEFKHAAVTSLSAHQFDDIWVFKFEDILYCCSTEALIVYGMCIKPYENPESTVRNFIKKKIFQPYDQ